MIYTKTNSHHGYFDPTFFKPLTAANFENNSVYWYDQHDWAIKNTPFNQFIDQSHWEHLQRDPTSKILIFYGDEYYNWLDIEDWVLTLKKWNIRPQQVYVLCLDENWATWTKNQFSERDYNGVNVQSYNLLMSRVEPQEEKPIVKKFSALSRNYNKWRLRLYAVLFNQNLLTRNFNYTFNNINPYGTITVYPTEDVKKDLIDLNFTLTPNLEKWVDGMPYALKSNRIQEKLGADAYDMIRTSGINIVVESHFDPFWNFGEHRHMHPQQFSPSFPTEKMYKPIACRRPFIVFSTPWFLKEFKNLGYKTFHPYIDESYDNIQDDVERLHAIAKEVKRLCSLSSSDFINLMENCKKITEHNFKTMENLKKDISLKPEFEWIKPYLDKNYKLI
jgi:hypothetical protein